MASDTFTMGATALVGLAVSSHVAGVTATATFDHVTVTPVWGFLAAHYYPDGGGGKRRRDSAAPPGKLPTTPASREFFGP